MYKSQGRFLQLMAVLRHGCCQFTEHRTRIKESKIVSNVIYKAENITKYIDDFANIYAAWDTRIYNQNGGILDIETIVFWNIGKNQDWNRVS